MILAKLWICKEIFTVWTTSGSQHVARVRETQGKKKKPTKGNIDEERGSGMKEIHRVSESGRAKETER